MGRGWGVVCENSWLQSQSHPDLLILNCDTFFLRNKDMKDTYSHTNIHFAFEKSLKKRPPLCRLEPEFLCKNALLVAFKSACQKTAASTFPDLHLKEKPQKIHIPDI